MNAPFGRFSYIMVLCISARILCFFHNEPRKQQKMVPACQECGEVVIDAISVVHCIALRHWTQRMPEQVTDRAISSSSLLQNPPQLSVHLAKKPVAVFICSSIPVQGLGMTGKGRDTSQTDEQKKLREFGLVKIQILPLLSSFHPLVRKNKV